MEDMPVARTPVIHSFVATAVSTDISLQDRSTPFTPFANVAPNGCREGSSGHVDCGECGSKNNGSPISSGCFLCDSATGDEGVAECATIIMGSPTKTWNLAGLHASYLVIPVCMIY